MSDPLGLLGLARRAGRLEIGERASSDAARAGKARLICSASDVSEGSLKRVSAAAGSRAIPIIELSCTKLELGPLFGRETCGILAVTDIGLAAGFVKALAAEEPDIYGGAARLLEDKDTRIRGRKAKSGKRRKN